MAFKTYAPGTLAGYTASDGAAGFLRSLIDGRDPGADADLVRRIAILARHLEENRLDAAVCSRAIEKLKVLPAKPAPVLPEVPDGWYALGAPANATRYQVRNGRKAGIVFVDQISGQGQKTPLRPVDAHETLRSIDAVGWQAAGRLYGHVTGECSNRRHPLTDPVSLTAGYGPDCRKKFGIPTPSKAEVDAHMAALAAAGLVAV